MQKLCDEELLHGKVHFWGDLVADVSLDVSLKVVRVAEGCVRFAAALEGRLQSKDRAAVV